MLQEDRYSLMASALRGGVLPPAWYSASITDFVRQDPHAIVGALAANGEYSILPMQRDAWLFEIRFLQDQLLDLVGSIHLEFTIPRMGSRIDAVLLLGSVVFVLEFKVGAEEFTKEAERQVWDYALDLKNFHEASHLIPIVPMLIATRAQLPLDRVVERDEDSVYRPIRVTTETFRRTLDSLFDHISAIPIDNSRWASAPYKPTPTIVEAARALYAKHSVEAIARFDAGAQNLSATSGRIELIVDEARTLGLKTICFVTGVPGAGKTLVGLNVATLNRHAEQPELAVFLSGNGPLVAVLREALARDEVARASDAGKAVRIGHARQEVKSFIQNVHHFRDAALRDTAPPVEHVVVFDEAQRAWDHMQASKFMKRKKKILDFSHSEPEFLLSYMDRRQDWAVVVCLVGGGQEINTGEAGISTWLQAMIDRFSNWKIYISPHLTDSEYGSIDVINALRVKGRTSFDPGMHLSVSMRSFRSENVSNFVKALLDCDVSTARGLLGVLLDKFPIWITRDLKKAKSWIKTKARGSERYGLVASSRAERLKPHAVDVRFKVDPVHWFLNDRGDTRSSYYLEDAATEYDIQGLELDWICVTWDGDLRFTGKEWTYHSFRGDTWCKVKKAEIQQYLKNAYRVLLTRARQGMVIFVPEGDAEDPTRSAEFYDPTFKYLTGLGIPTLE